MRLQISVCGKEILFPISLAYSNNMSIRILYKNGGAKDSYAWFLHIDKIFSNTILLKS